MPGSLGFSIWKPNRRRCRRRAPAAVYKHGQSDRADREAGDTEQEHAGGGEEPERGEEPEDRPGTADDTRRHAELTRRPRTGNE
jgi:hypothetical protein